jgi:hypothetical protein
MYNFPMVVGTSDLRRPGKLSSKGRPQAPTAGTAFRRKCRAIQAPGAFADRNVTAMSPGSPRTALKRSHRRRCRTVPITIL